MQARLEELAPGETLELVLLQPPTQVDLAIWCSMAGHDFMAVDHKESSDRFRIRKRSVDSGR